MSLQNGKIIPERFIRDFVLDHKTGRSRQYGPVIVQSLLRFPFFFERIWAISQVCTYHYCFSILHRSTYIHNEFGQQKYAVENEVYRFAKLSFSNVHCERMVFEWRSKITFDSVSTILRLLGVFFYTRQWYNTKHILTLHSSCNFIALNVRIKGDIIVLYSFHGEDVQPEAEWLYHNKA